MGRIRKMLSVLTLGLVRFRNEKEKTYKAIKKSNKIAKRQMKQEKRGL